MKCSTIIINRRYLLIYDYSNYLHIALGYAYDFLSDIKFYQVQIDIFTTGKYKILHRNHTNYTRETENYKL